MITNADNSQLNGPPTGCLVFIFTVRIIQSFPGHENHSNGLDMLQLLLLVYIAVGFVAQR